MREIRSSTAGASIIRAVYNVINANYSRFLRFGVVGVSNTLIDFVVFWLLFYGLGMGLILSHVCAFSLAVINSFIWNFLWTFERRGGDRLLPLALHFFAVSTIVMGLSIPLLWALQWLIPVWMAKAAVIGFSVLSGYILHARLVFRT